MFFPRLRRHAKWMFVLLALIFGLGFVLFGVGAGGVGVGDIFRDSGGTAGQSVSDAREKTEESPKDPASAVVLGGSPDRVAATLVRGEDRYRRGTSAWPDSRRAARRARSRMLP